MTATITNMDHWRRSHARKQCDVVTMAEDSAHLMVRFWSAWLRDQLRFWWHV